MKVATQIVERRVVADDCQWMPMDADEAVPPRSPQLIRLIVDQFIGVWYYSN
jgi:hypothetical protein